MRVIVCGGREFNDREAVRAALLAFPDDTIIVTGGARGADTLAHEEAVKLGYPTEVHEADWATYKQRAGIIRNKHMLTLGASAVLAFPGGRGTADMVARASAAGVPIYQAETGRGVGSTPTPS